jgi:translation initiation factor IF-2
MSAGELWKQLRDRGLEIPSVMAILEGEEIERVRRVARGEMEVRRPDPGKPSEIKLPPPVVPAPARPIHPVSSRQPKRPAPTAPRGGAAPRRGIKIFKQKETRERRSKDKQRAEEIFTGRTLNIQVPIALKDFSQQIGVKANTLLLHLMKQGIMANPNYSLDEEAVLVLAEAFNRTVAVNATKSVEDELEELIETHDAEAEEEAGTIRPPIVAVLGHVDHGKTSLLDKIRDTRVAAGEAGGITQHIGAYQVRLDQKRKITFLDTPGHEAFTAMRARGAKVTDIVILIVAADDGVMPQTEEAIAHAKAAGVPIIVAVNKCDKPEAQPDRARSQLATAGLTPEEWGGDVAMINCSATTGDGIQTILERIALEAELLDLKANPERPAEGYVIEASKQTGRGVVATLLVKNGTLRRGDQLLSGATQGKVKSLMDDRGKLVKAAKPSMPVQVTGFEEPPEAGWRFQVVRDKDLAKKVATERSHRQRESELAAKQHPAFEKLMDRIGSQDVRELLLVVKADVKGSVEAIRAKLTSIGNEEVKVKLLHAGVGAITESDVLLAQTVQSRAMVLGFHVVADAKARQTAERTGVEIRTYQIIYELLEDVRRAVEGLLPTESEEVVLGHAEIRALFKHRKRNIAGCMVTDGVARRDAHVRLTRDGRVVVNDAKLESLRRFKDDAKEVKEGFDCGIVIADYDDVKEGDVIEFYAIEERERTL